MKNGTITADTLAKILDQIAETNDIKPGLGLSLFEDFTGKVCLLGPSANDKTAD